jgi:ribosome-binding factor A
MAQRKYPRTARLDEVVLEVLATELERFNDPRLVMVTLTGVEISNDLSHAAVYFTSHGTDNDAQKALDAAGPRLRGVLGRSVRMKQTPALRFMPDPAIEHGQRVDELLREGGVRHDSLEEE